MNDCKVEHIIIDALAYSRQPLAPSVLDAARAELHARKQPRPHYVWAYAVVAVVVVVLCLSTALPLTLSTSPSRPRAQPRTKCNTPPCKSVWTHMA